MAIRQVSADKKFMLNKRFLGVRLAFNATEDKSKTSRDLVDGRRQASAIPLQENLFLICFTQSCLLQRVLKDGKVADGLNQQMNS
jgi:hypothetical protein